MHDDDGKSVDSRSGLILVPVGPRADRQKELGGACCEYEPRCYRA